MLRTRKNDEQNRAREAKEASLRARNDSKRSSSSSSSSSSSTSTSQKQMALTYAHVNNEDPQLPRGADPTRDERFIRMWYDISRSLITLLSHPLFNHIDMFNRDYYYVYCEAAFATRTLSVLQIVYTRQQNSSLA
jgi:hypothetical protein